EESTVLEEKRLSEKNEEYVTVLEEVVNERSLRDKHKKLLVFQSQIDTKLKMKEKDVSFFHDNDTCPTCRQEIDPDFKTTIIAEIGVSITDYEDTLKKLSSSIDDVVSEIEVIDT